MKTLLSITAVFISFMFFACSQRAQHEKAETLELSEPVANSTPSEGYFKPEAKKEKEEEAPPPSKFIRQADIKFQVGNVQDATDIIESFISRAGGFVTNSRMESKVESSGSVRVTCDSSLETKEYTEVNNMILRVPNRDFDTTMKSLSQLALFLDHRNIQADDVALAQLSNRLLRQRSQDHADRLEKDIDTRGRKLDDVVNAEDRILESKAQSDEARISNMASQDKVNFSTVVVSIYQQPRVRKEMIAYYQAPVPYHTGFGTQLIDALLSGWYILESILIFLARTWGLILLAVVSIVVFRQLSRKISTVTGKV